jgi:hypothetical protein
MEKKTLKLELHDHDSKWSLTGGAFAEPLWCFTSKPINGKIKALMTATYCRESVCDYIRQDIRKVTSYKIVRNRLHLFINRRVPAKTGAEVFQNQVMASLHMINAIEQHYGWPFTRIYPADIGIPKHEERNKYYYISATKRWMKSPQMLSMFMLFFRIICLRKTVDMKAMPSIDAVFDHLNKLTVHSRAMDATWFKTHGSRWRLVLDNYQRLFGKKTMERLYYPATGSYFFSEGINSFCDHDSEDRDLRAIFKRICKQ